MKKQEKSIPLYLDLKQVLRTLWFPDFSGICVTTAKYVSALPSLKSYFLISVVFEFAGKYLAWSVKSVKRNAVRKSHTTESQRNAPGSGDRLTGPPLSLPPPGAGLTRFRPQGWSCPCGSCFLAPGKFGAPRYCSLSSVFTNLSS